MQVQKCYLAKANELKKKWYLIDAKGQILGRLASQIATLLMGKHKPQFTPYVDTGDFVIVTNADKIKVTGNKMHDKIYYAWSGYPGGLTKRTLEVMMQKHPERVIFLAVRRMLPKTSLGINMIKKLKIYAGTEHPHAAQSPETWKGFCK